jgi:hypothetical protein
MTASAHDQFEAVAAGWDAAGRPAAMLVRGYSLIAQRCWSWSPGAKVDGVSATLKAFIAASQDALPEDWIDAYFDDRESCARCGESYRFENIRLCTHCHRTVCHRCGSTMQTAPNGNTACACGGELVG